MKKEVSEHPEDTEKLEEILSGRVKDKADMVVKLQALQHSIRRHK